MEKLRRSVVLASKGSGTPAKPRIPDADIDAVVGRILSEVRGEVRVTSGQLSAAALRVLKEWNSLAFLQYASVAKRFGHVSDYLTEAEALEASRVL
jgi:transcriptional regulator NrdR family protein